jgi:phospholipid/cholesterol/gamma-HCH transport system ATP-binding protein
MIELYDVHKAFGHQPIYEGVNLRIPDGDRLFIVGGSGTGKSVLTKLILGLEEPDRGTIKIDGRDTQWFSREDWQGVLEQFGVVFQGSALFDSLNVLENVGIKLFEARELTAAAIEERVVAALAQVNLGEETLGKYPSELSGGMRKRVGIARAVIQEPRYLVYDEPTTGLDPASSNVIDDLIGSLAQHPGRSTLVVTHDMISVRKLASRVVMVHDRRLFFDGEVQAFFASNGPVISNFLARERG